MNNFPPQAYTRDTLSAAYQWLRDQPGSIRELAQDSDSLVALFMQARRRPGSLSQTLASTENFKEDLKVLAQGLKQFEGPKPPAQIHTPAPAKVEMRMPEFRAPDIKSQEIKPQETKSPEVKSQETSQTVSLDAKSIGSIVDVQKRLNLSSPNEALRMIISVGVDRLKDILPKV